METLSVHLCSSLHECGADLRSRQAEGVQPFSETAMLEFERQGSSGDELAINEANHEFHLAADSAFFGRGLPGCACRVAGLSRQCFLEGDGAKDTRLAHLGKTR